MNQPAPKKPAFPSLQEHQEAAGQAPQLPKASRLRKVLLYSSVILGGSALLTYVVFGQKIARMFKPASVSGMECGSPMTSEDSRVTMVNTQFDLSKMTNK